METSEAAGHRSRLRQRYMTAGASSLADHEKMELLLTYALPRVDTKPLARQLIARFKTISGVLNAETSALQEVKGMGDASAALLHLVRDLFVHCLGEKIQRTSVMARHKDVEEYLRMRFGLRRDEYAAALFLDGSNRIIADEVISEGTINQCAVYPRTIMEKAIRVGAAAVILCHNHPAGATQPSEEDWSVTTRLCHIGKLMDIPLIDHLIVAQDRVISLKEQPRWPK
jgi:DNA repair protein RadC